MLRVTEVVKYYDEFLALDHVAMQINKGSVYGLVGPNGAGKTTLIKIIAGIYQADQGKILLENVSIYDNKQIKQRLVYISDDLYFYPMYSTKQMARFYGRMYQTFDWERYNKIKDVLSIDEKKAIGQLSKGMKKQVAFWLSICLKPDMLILDEPVDGLDPVMRRQIWSLLMDDVVTRQMTVLISSHNLRELEDVCDYVGIMHQGKIILERDLDDLKMDIHKVQCAFEKPVEKIDLTLLKEEKTGSVYSLIVRGKKEQVVSKLEEYNPYFVDFIPLTLEEIFIYEVGGKGYESKKLFL